MPQDREMTDKEHAGTEAVAAPPPPNTYYPLFDWLRIGLATVVALFHDDVIRWPSSGNLAVQVFFALSGWLIGGILLETSPRKLSRFWFNRATRIWIPYAVGLALLLGAAILHDHITRKWLEFVFYKLTFTYNLFGPSQLQSARHMMPLQGTGNHYWSVCAEEQFYLMAPLVLVLLPRRIGRSLALWVAIAALAIATNTYGAITLGVLAAITRDRIGKWHQTTVAKYVLLVIVAATAVALAKEVPPYEFVAPFFSIAVVLLLAREGKKSQVGSFLGGVSYPFYLNHWIGVFAIHAAMKPLGLRDSLLAKVLALVANFGICSMLYVLVDRRVMAVRGRWFRQRLGWTLAASGFLAVAVGVAGGLILFR
jgi:peptidoglycan/LPS O-acetylase OafA/YrhL